MDADRMVDRLNMPTPKGSTRGLRTNNPGNLRAGNAPWLGQTGVDEHGMCVFDTPENGIRALAKNLIAYQDVHALCTIRGIIGRWAPPNENDTQAYIAAVCKSTGFGPDDWLHLQEPSVLHAMVEAVIHQENGVQPFTEQQISAAVMRALA